LAFLDAKRGYFTPNAKRQYQPKINAKTPNAMAPIPDEYPRLNKARWLDFLFGAEI